MPPPFKDRDIPDAGKHVTNLTEMRKLLDEYQTELEALNYEEKLFKFDLTQFPMLFEIKALKAPFDDLWLTFAKFQTSENLWMKGSFQGLNAEEISEEVQVMWRIMHKLQKTFADQIMPRKVADFCKHKIDRFKNHIPLLLVICNPGLRPRHWALMSDIIGKKVQPRPESSLQEMIDNGMSKLTAK